MDLGFLDLDRKSDPEIFKKDSLFLRCISMTAVLHCASDSER